MRSGVASDQLFERAHDRIGERHRQTERQRTAERVAIAGRVLGGGESHLVADADLDRPPLVEQRGQPRRPGRRLAAQIDLGGGEIADLAEHIVQLVGRPGTSTVGEALQFEFDVGEHAGVEQLTQLFGAEQLAQQVAVERQRRGTTLGQRRVALVHVLGDPVEQQARRHRARRRRVDLHQPQLARLQLPEHLAQRRHVEHVLQALAGRLEQDRERRVLRGDRQQVGGTLTLLPQRRALVGTAARQQQRPPGALAEAGREQRRLRQRGHDQLVDVAGIDHEHVEVELVGRLGEPDHDAVVAPHRLDRQVVPVDQAPLDRHRPRARAPGCRTG